jgi:hypothetical protein
MELASDCCVILCFCYRATASTHRKKWTGRAVGLYARKITGIPILNYVQHMYFKLYLGLVLCVPPESHFVSKLFRPASMVRASDFRCCNFLFCCKSLLLISARCCIGLNYTRFTCSLTFFLFYNWACYCFRAKLFPFIITLRGEAHLNGGGSFDGVVLLLLVWWCDTMPLCNCGC